MSFEKPDASVIAEHALETPRRKERPPFSPELVRSSQAYELLYEAEHGFLPGDDPVVQEVVQLLTDYPGEDKPVRLRVSLDSESPNAFVLPSGTIVINRALLGMLDVQEMKVVIAHEIRHFRSRDAEEFTQAVEDIQASNKKVKKSVALLGRMRFAESRADIHGLIDGDEGGTHPAALRTLMQKLEKWKRDNVPDAATGKVHGSEIDRIVNAGMAAQVYDFSTDYSVRTPFSERVEAFCAAEIPPRWPESGECEPEEAEAAFKDASPMEILSCLRRWRIDDRMAAAEIFDEEYIRLKKKIDEGGKNLKTDQKKLKELEEQGVEVQIVGDGYEVAVRHLEAKVAEKARTATELQRKALVHFLLESTAGISSHELLDSPIEGVRSYLDDIEDRAALQEVLAVISPDRIRELGAVCMGGAGVAQFTGNVFRSANEAGVFKTDGVFDVAGYLEEMMASVRATAHVLEEVSLQGKRGYQLPDAAIDELLVNIDVHESAKPAFDALLEFQRVMSEAGLPSRSGKLLAALRRQHFYKDVEHEEIYAHEGPDKLYGTHIDRFVVRLYEGAHPLCRQMPVGHYAALAGCPVFADNPKDYDDFSVEGKEKTASDVAKVLFGKGREEIAFLLTILVKKPGRDEFREAIGLERGGEPAYALAVCERLQFSRLLTSLDRFKEFCAALNAMDEDAASENGEKESYFVSVAALSIAHLMSQVGTIDWLPKEKDKALLTLVEAMADTPGRAVSQLIGDLHCLEGMTGLVDTQDVWRVGLQMAKLVLNHDGRTARDPEVHVRQADPKANRLDLGDELVPILRFLKRTAEESLRHKEFTQEDTIRLVEELHEVIFRLRKVVPLAPRKDSEVLDTDEEFALYLLEKVQDLERPISRRLCLYAASHIHDVMLRARLVRHVVAREFATGTMSVSDKIDLLWKNPHVRPVPLGTLRDRVIDEEVQSPEQLTQLREIVLEQVDQVFSGDRMGAYAVLESLERRKDAMTLFRLAFEYSEFDEDAKRDIFLTIRQDWSELGISSTDEVALIRTEAILQSLEVAEPLLKHALMRKLLIGERGLLHTPKRRRELFAYLLDSVVDVTDSSAELLEVTREMLDVVAEVGETDVLFMALSPFLEERVFLPAKKKADWIPILRDIYNSGQKARGMRCGPVSLGCERFVNSLKKSTKCIVTM